MKKRKLKVVVKSNWDTATPEQKEKFMEWFVSAYQILIDSVVNRKVEELSNRTSCSRATRKGTE